MTSTSGIGFLAHIGYDRLGSAQGVRPLINPFTFESSL